MRIDILAREDDLYSTSLGDQRIRTQLSGYTILVDGERTGASVNLIKSTSGEVSVKLDGKLVQAVVYREGVMIANTTAPPLRKRGTQ